MAISVTQTKPVSDTLDWMQFGLDSIINLELARSGLCIVGAVICIYLMQAMTWGAGFRNPLELARMGQRLGLLFLSIGLAIGGVTPFLEGGHRELNSLMIVGPLFLLLFASAALVHLNGTASRQPEQPMAGHKVVAS